MSLFEVPKMIKSIRTLALVGMTAFSSLGAQTPAADPSARLREVLPADVAERVLARIAAARARELPAAALENRALKFAARGVPAADIEQSISAHAERMEKTKDAIEQSRGRKAEGDEVDAGAEAMRKGVDGKQVSELAKSAPSGRSLAVPLMVIGSLIDRGLPSDAALQRVQERMQQRATDRELEGIPGSVGTANKPAVTGTDLAATKRPPTAGKPATTGGAPTTTGAPTTVPRNAGKGTTPAAGKSKRP
jgi:hypothetical protein